MGTSSGRGSIDKAEMSDSQVCPVKSVCESDLEHLCEQTSVEKERFNIRIQKRSYMRPKCRCYCCHLLLLFQPEWCHTFFKNNFLIYLLYFDLLNLFFFFFYSECYACSVSPFTGCVTGDGSEGFFVNASKCVSSFHWVFCSFQNGLKSNKKKKRG